MRRHVIVARVAKVIALSGVLGLATACSDTTGPADTPPTVETPVPPAMVNVAAALDDMTQWWMPSIQNQTVRTNLQDTINNLKGHLTTGKVALCRQDITQARAIISSMADPDQVEIGHVGLAFDVVDVVLDAVSK